MILTQHRKEFLLYSAGAAALAFVVFGLYKTRAQGTSVYASVSDPNLGAGDPSAEYSPFDFGAGSLSQNLGTADNPANLDPVTLTPGYYDTHPIDTGTTSTSTSTQDAQIIIPPLQPGGGGGGTAPTTTGTGGATTNTATAQPSSTTQVQSSPYPATLNPVTVTPITPIPGQVSTGGVDLPGVSTGFVIGPALSDAQATAIGTSITNTGQTPIERQSIPVDPLAPVSVTPANTGLEPQQYYDDLQGGIVYHYAYGTGPHPDWLPPGTGSAGGSGSGDSAGPYGGVMSFEPGEFTSSFGTPSVTATESDLPGVTLGYGSDFGGSFGQVQDCY